MLGSEALQALFENGKSPLSNQFLRWKLWKKWDEFAGPTISAYTEPVGYVRGTLYVWVKNSSWMQQLVFMREPLRDSLNQKLGFVYVKSIFLTLDKKAVPRDEAEARDLRDSLSKLMREDSSAEPPDASDDEWGV